jgi:hypothetical protein
MAVERDPLRDWHRLFGMLLKDFFTGSPFQVEVERDLSEQQQLLDVVIVRKGRGRFAGRLPDGLDGLVAHNLISFKSHREALDAWAMKELVGHDVAYRKLVSPSPSRRLPDDQFRLYAVAARFPHNLSGQVPWRQQQAGVYDCRWGTDLVRVIVVGELPLQEHNAPLHLFSASAEPVAFGRRAYRRRSEHTSRLLRQLFDAYQGEDFVMPFTWEDFDRWYTVEHFARLTPQEQLKALESLPPERRREVLQSLPLEARREVLQSLPLEARRDILQSLPPEERLEGLSVEQIRQYLEQLTAGRPAAPRKPRGKK